MGNNTNTNNELHKQILMYIINAVGLWGVYLILYNAKIDVIAILTNNMDLVTGILTILGVIFTAISIYMQPSNKPEKVEKFSLWLSSPLVIILAVVTIALMLLGFKVNYALNGLSILGLCGSSIRMFKSTKWWIGYRDITANDEVASSAVSRKAWQHIALRTKILVVLSIISFSVFYIAGILEFYGKYSYSYIIKLSGLAVFLGLLLILLYITRTKEN